MLYKTHMENGNYQLEGQLLKIITFPHPLLKKVAQPVETFDEDLALLCKNMLYTMYKSPGVGLAAPQVGVGLRVFVVDVDYRRQKIFSPDGTPELRLSHFQPLVLINPAIVQKEGNVVFQEGCLSVPGVYEEVPRYNKITVEFFDIHGEKGILTTEGLQSVCIQHELDHLEGMVFLERLGSLKRDLVTRKFLKQKKFKKQGPSLHVT